MFPFFKEGRVVGGGSSSEKAGWDQAEKKGFFNKVEEKRKDSF